MTDPDCLFCKFVTGEVQPDIVYQDDDVLAFRDINPQAPTHVLIVPKRHIATINDLADSDAVPYGRIRVEAVVGWSPWTLISGRVWAPGGRAPGRASIAMLSPET